MAEHDPKTATAPLHAPRFLRGVVLFRHHDWFEAHEAWEDMWREAPSADRLFFKGLIHAAVGLCHYHNGNRHGAAKLSRSCVNYLTPYAPWHLGMNVAKFIEGVEDCFAGARDSDPTPLEIARLPVIELDPAPADWPALAECHEDGGE